MFQNIFKFYFKYGVNKKKTIRRISSFYFSHIFDEINFYDDNLNVNTH